MAFDGALEIRPKATQLICFCDVDGSLVHSSEATQQLGSYTGRSVHPGCVLWVDKVKPVFWSARAGVFAACERFSVILGLSDAFLQQDVLD